MNITEYIDNNKIIFARVLELPDYRGTEDDIRKVIDTNVNIDIKGVKEIENFQIRENGYVYGYVETGYNNNKQNRINLDKFGANDKDYLDGFLIVYISLKTSKIIGYYKNARIYENVQCLEETYKNLKSLSSSKGFNYKEDSLVQYFFRARKEDIHLFWEKNRYELDDIEIKGLNNGQSNIKYLDSNNITYVKNIISKMEKLKKYEEDILNFHQTLKFWIEQTNNNIQNKGKVAFQEITIQNSLDCIEYYKSPQFYPKFLNYDDFNIRISFFRTGRYKGERVNFIVSDLGEELGYWINIRYLYDSQELIASYRGDVKQNQEPDEYKKYMTANGFDTGMKTKIDDLNLGSSNPNEKTKALFDYFKRMIEKTKEYLKKEGENMKVNDISNKLLDNYNLILRGAPGTGKTYLAREVAAQIIGIPVEELDQSNQFAFVQFHPSYDYTDFVEGLRPTLIDGLPSFEIKSGIFKSFCDIAKISTQIIYNENSIKRLTLSGYQEYLQNIVSPKAESDYLRYIGYLLDKSKYRGNKNKNIPQFNSLEEIIKNKEVIERFDIEFNYGYFFITPVTHLINYAKTLGRVTEKKDKNFVFVIDEINRGEISRIFGELFFSIDPDYRGKSGSVYTQYSNLHQLDEKFYVPENVYIIGTMNDIDRSVDTFDFAMRRRFTFVELTAEYSQIMLKNKDVKERMNRLNQAIIDPDLGRLSEDYQIGGSYFLQLDKGMIDSRDLWDTKLYPLFKDYYRGNINSEEIILGLKKEYELETESDINEPSIER